jgi:pimeloyl-ACP methyl ester carboxylesterase
LRPLYRCIAPDLIGYGTSPVWPAETSFDLDAELRAIEPLLQCCSSRFHLVGYSYGGVLALHLALAHPLRVLSLTLIEPVFFAALKYVGDWSSYFQFCRVRDEFVSTLAQGNRELAMSRFMDFWMGNGGWTELSADTRMNMLKVADKIVLDWQASFAPIPGEPASPRWPCGRCWCVAATALGPSVPLWTRCTRSCRAARALLWQEQTI